MGFRGLSVVFYYSDNDTESSSQVDPGMQCKEEKLGVFLPTTKVSRDIGLSLSLTIGYSLLIPVTSPTWIQSRTHPDYITAD